MKTRCAARCRTALLCLLLALPLAIPIAQARITDQSDNAQSAVQALGDSQPADHAAISAKTAANGLQMIGNFSYTISGGTVQITLDQIRNASTTRTTGTLRLELWATTTQPAREAAFTGYRLAVSTTFSPLGPNSSYTSIVRTTSFTPPPDGTYWLVLVLSEYNSVSCSAADFYCISDTGVFSGQRTFGGSLEISGNFAYSISGTSVQLTVDRIDNNSGSRTSGTLRLELWAATTQPPRGAAFTGYQLAVSSTLNPLPPNTYYSNVVRNTTFSRPPDGTYWMVFVLAEFDSVNCPAADHFCIVDSGVFPLQETFGVPSGPTILTMVEYYHAGFDHYFVTGIPDEINKLDTGFFAGWARTGQQFKAYAIVGKPAGTSNVCRFFSTAFGVRSSHFYTPSATECQIVKGNPAWQFEAEVAAIASPVGSVPGSRTCAAGYIPLYRLYNNGKDGAPNHRYTTSLAIFNQMRSFPYNWTFEGEGITFVFACVPP
ncbi:MAG: hypothetical protein U1F41_00980 [Burkholderiales bacterium]